MSQEAIEIAYMRVSTDRQDAENQRRGLESITPAGVQWVSEQGSAWKKDGLKDRPEFQRIVELIRQRKVKRLYVWDLDRLYRKRKQAVAFMKLCKAMGTVVISYRQKYLLEIERAPEPWNEIIYDLIIQILAAQAEEESQKKSDRVKAKREIWERPAGKKEWGRPEAEFNRFRAYHLLVVEGASLRTVSRELGVSPATLLRFKKEALKNPVLYIKESDVPKRNDSETVLEERNG